MLNRYEQQLLKIKQLEDELDRRIEKYGPEDEETLNRIFLLNQYKLKCERMAKRQENKYA